VHPPHASDNQIAGDRPLDLNRKVSLSANDEIVGLTHRTVQINQDLRVRSDELDKSRRQPESAKTFRCRDPNFAAIGLCVSAAAPDKAPRRLFHLLRIGKKVLTIGGEANSIAMTGE
jgi:hypothetical protein